MKLLNCVFTILMVVGINNAFAQKNESVTKSQQKANWVISYVDQYGITEDSTSTMKTVKDHHVSLAYRHLEVLNYDRLDGKADFFHYYKNDVDKKRVVVVESYNPLKGTYSGPEAGKILEKAPLTKARLNRFFNDVDIFLKTRAPILSTK